MAGVHVKNSRRLLFFAVAETFYAVGRTEARNLQFRCVYTQGAIKFHLH